MRRTRSCEMLILFVTRENLVLCDCQKMSFLLAGVRCLFYLFYWQVHRDCASNEVALPLHSHKLQVRELFVGFKT